MATQIPLIPRDKDGKLPSFAWPGGYPIVYWTGGGDYLCAECATASSDENEPGKYGVQAGDVHWEGAPIACDRCPAVIESAYGDPEADCGE